MVGLLRDLRKSLLDADLGRGRRAGVAPSPNAREPATTVSKQIRFARVTGVLLDLSI